MLATVAAEEGQERTAESMAQSLASVSGQTERLSDCSHSPHHAELQGDLWVLVDVLQDAASQAEEEEGEQQNHQQQQEEREGEDLVPHFCEDAAMSVSDESEWQVHLECGAAAEVGEHGHHALSSKEHNKDSSQARDDSRIRPLGCCFRDDGSLTKHKDIDNGEEGEEEKENKQQQPAAEFMASKVKTQPGHNGSNSGRLPAPLVGPAQSFAVTPLSPEAARYFHPQLQRHHDSCFKVEMLARDECRTIRVDPPAVVCWRRTFNPVTGCQMWSYTFEVVVLNTLRSFLNIGLANFQAQEAGAARPASVARQPPGGHPSSGSSQWFSRLSQLRPVEGATETRSAPAPLRQEQADGSLHVMLGCKKGVRWLGSRKPRDCIFSDDVCSGSRLSFRCDMMLDCRHQVLEVKLVLLPSDVVFWQNGPQFVTLRKPLNECPAEWLRGARESGQEQAPPFLWVPAITFFSQGDEVLLAMRSTSGVLKRWT